MKGGSDKPESFHLKMHMCTLNGNVITEHFKLYLEANLAPKDQGIYS